MSGKKRKKGRKATGFDPARYGWIKAGEVTFEGMCSVIYQKGNDQVQGDGATLTEAHLMAAEEIKKQEGLIPTEPFDELEAAVERGDDQNGSS